MMPDMRRVQNSGVYAITNVATGGQYIGSTIDLEQRKALHLSSMRHQRHDNPRIQAAYNVQGKHVFCFELLEHITDIEQILPRERAWLIKLRPAYNIGPAKQRRFAVPHDVVLPHLRQWRWARRLTQWQVHHMAGLPGDMLGRAERGYPIDAAYVEPIAQVLQVTVHQLQAEEPQS